MAPPGKIGLSKPYENEVTLREQILLGNIGYEGQRHTKLHPPNFVNNSNPGTLEPGLHVLTHTLAEMAKLADLFLRPPTFITYL